MHPITFAFDIDDTLGLHFYNEKGWNENIQESVEAFGQEFVDQHRLDICEYPHFIFVGIPELWRWLYDQGHHLCTFSSAIKERNVPFVQGLARLAFGDRAESIIPEIRVFSREDCFDTTQLEWRDRDDYQPVFFGNRKKIMTNLVSPPLDMPWTLLVDDDRSYMALNEEYNIVVVECYPSMQALKPNSFTHFGYYYKAFFMAGLFQTIFDVIQQKNCTAVEAAKFVQFDSIGRTLIYDFYYPTKMMLDFYRKGEPILSALNPEARIPPQAMKLAAEMERIDRSGNRRP